MDGLIDKVCNCPDQYCCLEQDDCDKRRAYDAQLVAALRGNQVPDEEHLDNQFHAPICLIRGIRRHYEFAASSAVKDVCASRSALARARNARLIMSDVIPGPEDMDDSDQTRQPYCIWNPDFAAEDTYRQLAQRFPSMRYQVGRACAAAGYDGLYAELGLLPDVSIAEEARESDTPGGQAIFKMIMAFPCRYAIMDDPERSINLDSENPGPPAFLNGDTMVRWRLQRREELNPRVYNYRPWRRIWDWSIEEDNFISEQESSWPDKYNILTNEEVQLLYTPLPQDLPTMKKDLLVQMAAHDGNIDRYARLAPRWPMKEEEVICVLRGIYHNTMFARFWADEIKRNPRRVQVLKPWQLDSIKEAIFARRIMVNDIEAFNNGWPDGEPQPDVIWKPLQPHEHTLNLLAKKVPSMKKTAALACIFCDYEEAYKEINCTPHPDLATAAKQSRNPFYLRDIEQKVAEQGIDLFQRYREPSWLSENMEVLRSYSMPLRLEAGISVRAGWGGACWSERYNGVYREELSDSPVEIFVWLSPEKLQMIDLCEQIYPELSYSGFDLDWRDYIEYARRREEKIKERAAEEEARAARTARRPGESTEAWNARKGAQWIENRIATRMGRRKDVEYARSARAKYQAIVAREEREAKESVEKQEAEQGVPPPEPSVRGD
ncbi:hypothetical protein MGYG_08117 [Nannizzia gypsea CBS 118893]|uniref:Uncharacterized protein n=1 Tax=Arthroderma gypseum (strain ATCC MYA-4604 / CBS 118893) TaxID=535722 RepID=E4V534_ARTGP|nr:hypothetical protein MGYG_08117 [Nannizzia gypsea CBS 118893]EFR05108.1 hypothetical protein MGYG_08117 [Nannizzia gypsea CBS 118893]